MKKLLIALATTIALAGPAHAGSPTMPPHLRGTWCSDGQHPYLMQMSQLPDRSGFECEGTMTAATWDPHGEWLCKLTKIKANYSDGENLPEGEFSCPEGTKLRFFFAHGTKNSKMRRLYFEDSISKD
jgi:hypothetical protein